MPNVRVSWTWSADDVRFGGDVSYYEVARSDGPNPTSVVSSLPRPPFKERRPNGEWHYRVRAVDASENRSPWSAEVVATVDGQTVKYAAGAKARTWQRTDARATSRKV